MKRIFMLVSLLSFLFLPAAHASLVDFEDFDLTSGPPATDYTGPGGGQYYNGSDNAGGFVSGGASFNNFWSPPSPPFGDYWEGWAISNTTDTTTPGFTNQYSAITGGGASGSSNYGVAYAGFAGMATPPTVSFANPVTVTSGYFTNTTYAYRSMQNGDGFVEQFKDGDYQDLIITGLDQSDSSTGQVIVNLADYRNGSTFLLATWLEVDLTSLGPVSNLEFSFAGTQADKVPSYVAADNINAVPIPGALWLMGSGLVCLIGLGRRKAGR